MKPEEAIVILKMISKIQDEQFISEILGTWYKEVADDFHSALKMAIDALKKQIPMKPIGEHYAHMRCPSCNHRIPSGQGSSSRRRDNWCNYCGQKILWEQSL